MLKTPPSRGFVVHGAHEPGVPPCNSCASTPFGVVLPGRSKGLNIATHSTPQKQHMATLQVLSKQPATVREARDVNAVSTVVRLNQVPITNGGAIANMAGPQGTNAPLTSITFNLVNATAGALTYVIGDPFGMVEGAANPGVPWSKATSLGSGGSVAAITHSFATSPISVNGINYIVSDATQFDNIPMWHSAGQDNRYFRQPINLTAELRNTQFIATRQTLRFVAEPLAFNEYTALTVAVKANTTASITLLVGANAA